MASRPGTDVGGVAPGVVVGVAASEVADVEPSVVGGTGCVVGVVGARRPAGVAGVDAVVEVDLEAAVVVAEPSPAVVVADPPGVVESLGVDVVDAPSSAARHWSTGCSVTIPATSAASNASRWSRTPGRSTTMSEPSTRTSGSAIPRFSSSERTRSRMTTRSSSVAPSVGVRTTDTPPCRSRPRTGVLPKPRLRARPTTATPTMTSSDVHSRRRFIPRCRGWERLPSCRRRSDRRRGGLRRLRPYVRDRAAGVDLALDRRPVDPDLDVLVDLQPDSIVLLEAGDEAIDARGRHDLVTDLECGLQGLLVPRLSALGPDHQEVHRQWDEQEDAELGDGSTAPATGVGQEVEGHQVPCLRIDARRAPSQPKIVLRASPRRTAPRPAAG